MSWGRGRTKKSFCVLLFPRLMFFLVDKISLRSAFADILSLSISWLYLVLTALRHHSVRAECALVTTSISVLEWPMLQTIEPFFMRSSWSLVTTFLFPAETRAFAINGRQLGGSLVCKISSLLFNDSLSYSLSYLCMWWWYQPDEWLHSAWPPWIRPCWDKKVCVQC